MSAKWNVLSLLVLLVASDGFAQQPVNLSAVGGNTAASSGVNGLLPIGGYSSQNTSDAAWTSATSNNTRVTLISNVGGYNAILVTLVQGTTITGGQVTTQQSNDNSNWTGVQCVQLGTTAIVGPTYTLVASTNVMFMCPVSAPYFGVLLSPAITGSGTVTIGHNALTLPSVALVAGTETLATGANVIGSLTANQSVNTAQVNGTATDTNSGTKSAGTQRVVLATDQPQLTNKLLVTPDSVALPANQSVNVAQVAGTATDTNSGTKSAGTQRVVIATDQPQLTNKLLVTPDANVKVNVVGNAGANLDGATGSAVPANAILVGNTDGTNTRALYIDPCGYSSWTYYYVNVSANTQIAAAAGASKNYYICQMFILPVTGAANVNLVSSATAGNACATSTTALLTGGTTAATGATLTTNGGFVLPASNRAWAITQATNHAFCIFTSAAVTGVIAYAGPL